MTRLTATTRVLTALLVTALVMSAGASTALAGSGTANVEGDHADNASDITISGFDVGLEDVHITGEGLPEVDIEDRTYTVDERSVTVDGLTMTVNDAEIGLDDLTITVEDSTLELHDISIGGE